MPEVSCHACGKKRRADDKPCPHCAGAAYPHRRTAEEHADYLTAIRERDRIGKALEHSKQPSDDDVKEG